MEIEVLLPIKSAASINEYISEQKNFIERISFAAGTFQVFTQVNEVMDINNKKMVSKASKLSKIFKSPNTNPFVFVICKN